MDKFAKHSLVVILSVLGLFIVGCTSSASIQADIKPEVNPAERSAGNVAVVYGGGLENAVISIGPSGNNCGIHSYRIGNLGKSLSKALKNSVKTAYSNVAVEKEVPGNGAYDRVFEFDLVSKRASIRFLQDPLGYLNARTRTSLAVELQVYDGSSDDPVLTETLRGDGQFSKRVMCADGQKPLVVSTESAVRKVSKSAADVIVSEI